MTPYGQSLPQHEGAQRSRPERIRPRRPGLCDARGVPVSTASRRALDLYETALHQFHTYVGDPVASIDAALAEDPDFVLGHAFRATMLALLSEGRYVPAMRASVEAAEALAHRANPRERGLTAAARRWLDGDWPGACRAWEEVLLEHPRDAFALQSAHLTDFYLGDAVNLRDRIARVLPQWDAGLPSYSYILSLYAFGLEECNLYPEAEEVGRRALALEPRDGWGVHAVAHVMEMQGRHDEGIAWYTERQQDWAPDNGFAFHNWFHLALYRLERGEHRAALEIYDTQIYPQISPQSGDMALQMVDATAVLWRIHLQGVDVGTRWKVLADAWEQKSQTENGYYAFNDFHALMAYLGAGREPSVRRLIADMERAAATGQGVNARMTREVGLPLGRAFLAFDEGRYDEAAQALLPLRPIAHRFGGSHAQRDVLSQTLIEAAIRAGQYKLARSLVNERAARKPHSPLTLRWRSKVSELAGE